MARTRSNGRKNQRSSPALARLASVKRSSQPGRFGEPSGATLVLGVAHLVLSESQSHHLLCDPALALVQETSS